MNFINEYDPQTGKTINYIKYKSIQRRAERTRRPAEVYLDYLLHPSY
ncbi:DUF2963 domain-containing protein, partial [Chrysanthemum yellows phytoplasma]